ncbi:hypothetical protein PCE1_000203 [Barthelona sp. PCE]
MARTKQVKRKDVIPPSNSSKSFENNFVPTFNISSVVVDTLQHSDRFGKVLAQLQKIEELMQDPDQLDIVQALLEEVIPEYEELIGIMDDFMETVQKQVSIIEHFDASNPKERLSDYIIILLIPYLIREGFAKDALSILHNFNSFCSEELRNSGFAESLITPLRDAILISDELSNGNVTPAVDWFKVHRSVIEEKHRSFKFDLFLSGLKTMATQLIETPRDFNLIASFIEHLRDHVTCDIRGAPKHTIEQLRTLSVTLLYTGIEPFKNTLIQEIEKIEIKTDLREAFWNVFIEVYDLESTSLEHVVTAGVCVTYDTMCNESSCFRVSCPTCKTFNKCIKSENILPCLRHKSIIHPQNCDRPVSSQDQLMIDPEGRIFLKNYIDEMRVNNIPIVGSDGNNIPLENFKDIYFSV